MIAAEETFRSYHRELLARLELALEGLEDDAEDGGAIGSAVLSSLAEDFRRYVEANESTLYPAVAPLVRSQEQVMAPMLLDVRAIGDYASDGERTALEAVTASDSGRRARAQRIRLLVAHAEAVIRLHVEKLERIYLPLLAELSEEQRGAILAEMAASYGAPLEWPEAPSARGRHHGVESSRQVERSQQRLERVELPLRPSSPAEVERRGKRQVRLSSCSDLGARSDSAIALHRSGPR
jgi:hypothetical protein